MTRKGGQLGAKIIHQSRSLPVDEPMPRSECLTRGGSATETPTLDQTFCFEPPSREHDEPVTLAHHPPAVGRATEVSCRDQGVPGILTSIGIIVRTGSCPDMKPCSPPPSKFSQQGNEHTRRLVPEEDDASSSRDSERRSHDE